MPESNVLLKPIGSEGSVAEIKVEDPTFGRLVTQKFESQRKKGNESKISIKPMLGGTSSGALGNRLQLSTVTCIWFKPSRPAWLVYENRQHAIRAKQALESQTILGRTPTCDFQGLLGLSLQVGNLDISTKRHHILGVLAGSLKPRQITIGEPSHRKSDEEAGTIVKELLASQGELIQGSFSLFPQGSSKLKATATFVDRDTAAEAARNLNGTKIETLGKTKLFVNHIVSVKYIVLNAVFDALKRDLDQLRDNIWQNGHVHLKGYPQTEPAKPVTVIRLFGENLKRVAEAKAAAERLLAGTIVMDGDLAVWDPYFLTASSLGYLNDLSKPYRIYIQRDARKSRLLLYGGSGSTRTEVAQTLVAKVYALRQLNHTLVLSGELLKKAMQGGMRRLKARFGQAVSLNVSIEPRTVSITGSMSDFSKVAARCHQHDF